MAIMVFFFYLMQTINGYLSYCGDKCTNRSGSRIAASWLAKEHPSSMPPSVDVASPFWITL
ncbi:hypothetical protein AB7W62_03135 [Morganella morganii]|uniref:hypothetical protein n=1 Tax=Morganella morganii TaxID=582 RepID=UPI0034E5BB7C